MVEIKNGEYYHISEGDYYMIIKSTGEVEGTTHYYTHLLASRGDKYMTNDWCSSLGRTTRLATYEEINWLKACEKAGKYVEKSENLVESIEIW